MVLVLLLIELVATGSPGLELPEAVSGASVSLKRVPLKEPLIKELLKGTP